MLPAVDPLHVLDGAHAGRRRFAATATTPTDCAPYGNQTATATRIKARAINRCGELLRAIPSGQGAVNQHTVLREGALPTLTREQAASCCGLFRAGRQTTGYGIKGRALTL